VEILQTPYLLAKCHKISQHTCEKNSVTAFRKVWTFLRWLSRRSTYSLKGVMCEIFNSVMFKFLIRKFRN